ncbi:MAG: type II toxin-antitoxin system VapC family toxin [Syntrophales bacterium]|nr:type II toxin-antitoxin system VapC family toxin [Syntrophales bacterium]
MIFWDSSAIIPLFIEESCSAVLQEIVLKDMGMVIWWGTVLECRSALSRSQREGKITDSEEDQALEIIRQMSEAWSEVLPGEKIRSIAARLLMTHPLRAADALQLAAAIIWADESETACRFICLDKRLRYAARKEGFSVLPDGSAC